jgi:hypothetical protein
VASLCLVFFLAMPQPGSGRAHSADLQGPSQWSQPRRVPDYHDLLRAPYLAADSSRTVYAFDIELSEAGDFTIIYRSWSLAQGWSAPVDVLVLEFGGSAPALEGVFIDHAGMIHLIYFGSDAEGEAIFYTRAPAAEANHARSWSVPRRVGIDAGPVASAALTGDGNGQMVVVYAGLRQGGGLYEVHTTDGGEVWSVPVLISRTRGQELWPGPMWLETDDFGRVHAVWDIVDPQGLAVEVRYARLEAGLEGWGHEFILVHKQEERDILGWPSVVSRGSQVIAIYSNLFPTTRFMRLSEDGGLTWSAPVRPFPQVGGAEYAHLVKDSAGTVHMILGARSQDASLGGLWYSRLVGNQWTALEPISARPPSPPDPEFGPCCPHAVVSQGNILLATWPHNVRREFLTGAWYAYMVLDAPELPVIPLPTSTPAPEPSVTPATPSTVAATRTPRVGSSEGGESFNRTGSPAAGDPAGPILAGSVPILIIVFALILGRVTRPPAIGQGPGAAKSEDEGGAK